MKLAYTLGLRHPMSSHVILSAQQAGHQVSAFFPRSWFKLACLTRRKIVEIEMRLWYCET